MAKKVGSARGYEKMRYQIRDKPNQIALEGLCEKCNLYTSAAVFMLDYIKKMVYLPLSEPINGKCPGCGSEHSLIFPKVWAKAYQDGLYV